MLLLLGSRHEEATARPLPQIVLAQQCWYHHVQAALRLSAAIFDMLLLAYHWFRIRAAEKAEELKDVEVEDVADLVAPGSRRWALLLPTPARR